MSTLPEHRLGRRPPTEQPAAGSRVGGYRLGEAIERRPGEFAVFRARATDGRVVAVMLLDREIGAGRELRRRFSDLLGARRAADHPNLVSVLDFGRDDQWVYIAMGRYPAGSLADVLGNGPLEPREAVRVLSALVPAVEALHSRGIYELGLAPSVVRVEGDDVLLADLAAAAARLSGAWPDERYLAPEQLADRGPNPRADVYSLGAILYSCLTGVAPFAGEGGAGLSHALEPPRVRTRRSELPPAADSLIAKAMATRPEARYGSPQQLASAAEAALLQVPGSAWKEAVEAAVVAARTMDPAAATTPRPAAPGGDPDAAPRRPAPARGAPRHPRALRDLRPPGTAAPPGEPVKRAGDRAAPAPAASPPAPAAPTPPTAAAPTPPTPAAPTAPVAPAPTPPPAAAPPMPAPSAPPPTPPADRGPSRAEPPSASAGASAPVTPGRDAPARLRPPRSRLRWMKGRPRARPPGAAQVTAEPPRPAELKAAPAGARPQQPEQGEAKPRQPAPATARPEQSAPPGARPGTAPTAPASERRRLPAPRRPTRAVRAALAAALAVLVLGGAAAGYLAGHDDAGPAAPSSSRGLEPHELVVSAWAERFRAELRPILDRLEAARRDARTRLASARTPRAQAAAANRLAAAYDSAAGQARQIAVLDRGGERLVRGLAASGSGYAALAATARDGDRAGFASAKQRVEAAEQTLDGALRGLARG